MDKTTLLAKAIGERDDAVKAVNKAAKALVSAAEPFIHNDPKAILEAEESELVLLSTDVVEARGKLKAATDTVKALSRE